LQFLISEYFINAIKKFPYLLLISSLSIRLFSDLWEQYDSKKIKKLHLSDGIGLCDALQLKGDAHNLED
jgi:hypothetical protein